jgi:hypothetical protein
VGWFGSKGTTEVPVAAAVSYDQGMNHIGAQGSVRDDDVTWDMRIKASGLTGYHVGFIERRGSKVRVVVDGKTIGTLPPEAQSTANIALLQHGGKRANCFITAGTSKGDIVRVAKINGGVVNL